MFFIYFHLFKQTVQCLQQINMKNVHPVFEPMTFEHKCHLLRNQLIGNSVKFVSLDQLKKNKKSINHCDLVDASVSLLMLQNFFGMKSGKSRFPLKPEQQEQAILNATNSSRVLFCLKIAQFSHFYAGSDRTNFIQFLNFGEIQISSKQSFLTSTTGACLLLTITLKSLKAL